MLLRTLRLILQLTFRKTLRRLPYELPTPLNRVSRRLHAQRGSRHPFAQDLRNFCCLPVGTRVPNDERFDGQAGLTETDFG